MPPMYYVTVWKGLLSAHNEVRISIWGWRHWLDCLIQLIFLGSNAVSVFVQHRKLRRGSCLDLLCQGSVYLEFSLADWNELFTTKCVSCGFPIEAGDRFDLIFICGLIKYLSFICGFQIFEFFCGFQIYDTRWVEALNNNYHSQCFNCSVGFQQIDIPLKITMLTNTFIDILSNKKRSLLVFIKTIWSSLF